MASGHIPPGCLTEKRRMQDEKYSVTIRTGVILVQNKFFSFFQYYPQNAIASFQRFFDYLK
jgi:hypothetical protein